MKLAVDAIEYCTKNMPRFNHVSLSSSHFRDAGASPITAASFLIADAKEYIRWILDRGLKIDEFAPRMSFLLQLYTDIFEEVARLRALRRLWARLLREHFGAKDPRSYMFRTALCAGGISFSSKREPYLNLVRGALGLLACVLGGGQTIWMSGIDEGYEIPTPEALKLSVRAAQIIAEETSIPDVVDPLAGSYYMEWLTDEMERRIKEKIVKIDEMGGALAAIKRGYYSKEITKEAFEWHRKIQSGETAWIGENRYVEEVEKTEIKIYEPSSKRRRKALESLTKTKRSRNNVRVKEALTALEKAVESYENLMPYFIEAVKAYVTVSEISDVLKKTYGEFEQITAI
ncbi:MAG: methylmalonyl-CoA mutase, partial [Nitrososphaeria archaeon]|nr:methylmalonyl-CoA mutase [Nitrososphaeria archaeon]NIN52171.1 methylmalonyl-CoA mutase [Nitrososphaeria archaeon]NIQ32624.1 methylmalonyl-CoA mutase [Nitrososphaeria archaeon]